MIGLATLSVAGSAQAAEAAQSAKLPGIHRVKEELKPLLSREFKVQRIVCMYHTVDLPDGDWAYTRVLECAVVVPNNAFGLMGVVVPRPCSRNELSPNAEKGQVTVKTKARGTWCYRFNRIRF